MTPAPFRLPRQRPRSTTTRPRYLPTKGCWTEPEPVSMRGGLTLLALGVVVISSYVALNGLGNDSGSASLLVVLGGAFALVGVGMLCCTAAIVLNQRITRLKKHCGCCRFYQAAPGQYALGRCQADPSGASVQRTDGCPSFCYSPRAMVRDRLSQRPEMLAQVRVMPSVENPGA